MLNTILLVVQVVLALSLVGLILLQRGKGAEAGAAFGGGASGTVFGARGSSNFLSRATAIFATLFIANSLALAHLATERPDAPDSVLDRVQTSEQVPVPADEETGVAPADAELPSLGDANGPTDDAGQAESGAGTADDTEEREDVPEGDDGT